MLTRQANPRDGRSVVLRISNEGREVTGRLWEAHRAAVAASLDRLTGAQKSALREILATLNDET